MTIPHTTSANVALVRSTLDAFNEGDLDTCVARMGPDFVMNLAGLRPMRGVDAWRQGPASSGTASPTCTRASMTWSPRATGWPSG